MGTKTTALLAAAALFGSAYFGLSSAADRPPEPGATAAATSGRGGTEVNRLRSEIRARRVAVLRKATLMRLGGVRVPRPRWGGAYREIEAPDFLRWVLKRDRAYRRQVNRLWSKPPNLDSWVSVHMCERGSGGWATNTGNGYYGGLQMDRTFQSSYAPAWILRKGTADRWTMLEQIWTAHRAWLRRGWSPWPVCGRLA